MQRFSHHWLCTVAVALHYALRDRLVMHLLSQRTNHSQPRTYAITVLRANLQSRSNAVAIAKKNAGAGASVGIPF
jgi:hypothetical protein